LQAKHSPELNDAQEQATVAHSRTRQLVWAPGSRRGEEGHPGGQGATPGQGGAGQEARGQGADRGGTAGLRRVAAYEKSVFVNCPFDGAYRPLFQALIFTIYDCGFEARCALEAEDGGEERIRKIKRIIRECRYGIHDISRVQLDALNRLPRFNMPLELGLFLGAQEYGSGPQRQKRSLILDTEPYRYQKFCSDIAGQDVRAHGDRPARLIAAVRAMLSTSLDGRVRLPGEAKIRSRYAQFRAEFPSICRRMHLRPSELQFVEFRALLRDWLSANPL
jgi:hypothetical protein